MPIWFSITGMYGIAKDLMFSLIHFRKDKLAIEFEDGTPFRRFEHEGGEFSKQHYAIRVHNIDPLHRPQDGLKVMLTKLQRTRHTFNLPIELRYRDRSGNRHHLNPGEKVFIDVLSFDISVERDHEGFFINFHGDNETDYQMPCDNCRIRLEISSSKNRPISKDFEIGLGVVEESGRKKNVFFMRKALTE